MAQGRQARQGRAEVRHPGPAAGGGVQGEDLVGPVLEDRADEGGEPGPRPHLEEGADARGVHVLDDAHELHGRGQLAREQFPRRVRIGRVLPRRAVGEDGDPTPDIRTLPLTYPWNLGITDLDDVPNAVTLTEFKVSGNTSANWLLLGGLVLSFAALVVLVLYRRKMVTK